MNCGCRTSQNGTNSIMPTWNTKTRVSCSLIPAINRPHIHVHTQPTYTHKQTKPNPTRKKKSFQNGPNPNINSSSSSSGSVITSDPEVTLLEEGGSQADVMPTDSLAAELSSAIGGSKADLAGARRKERRKEHKRRNRIKKRRAERKAQKKQKSEGASTGGNRDDSARENTQSLGSQFCGGFGWSSDFNGKAGAPPKTCCGIQEGTGCEGYQTGCGKTTASSASHGAGGSWKWFKSSRAGCTYPSRPSGQTQKGK